MLEEIARILTVRKNKEITYNICYNYKQKKWVQIPKIDESHIYLNFEGNYFFNNTHDAIVYSKEKEIFEAKRRSFYDPNLVDDYIDIDNIKKFRILKNDFNFADRKSQTKIITTRDSESQTEEIKNVNFSDYASPYMISQIYEEHFELMTKLNEMKKKKKKSNLPQPKIQPITAQEQKLKENERFLKSAMIIERMISQNNYQDIMLDFKYWDDEADDFRTEGSLLPLWKFSSNLTKHRLITSISWSSSYNDLFAVATGSCKI